MTAVTPFLHPDRLFPAEPSTRNIARMLYAEIKDAPIVSPHGHTDPRWYAKNNQFPDPATLFVVPDHYVFRMLYSHGVALEKLGIPRVDGGVGPAQNLGFVCSALAFIPWHANAAVARSCILNFVWHQRNAHTRQC